MTGIQKAPNHPLIASDRIEGTLVRRPDGEKIGKIKRLMIDKESGTISYAVMSFGGLFGLGDNYYQIPWSLLKYNQSLDAYESDIPDEQLAKTFLPHWLPLVRPHLQRDLYKLADESTGFRVSPVVVVSPWP